MVDVGDEYYLDGPDDYELFSAGNISVPFKWEEAPGKPTIAYDQMKRQEAETTTVLQLPPILQWKQSTFHNNDGCDQCNHDNYNGRCGYGSCSCSTKSACSNHSKSNGHVLCGRNHECCPSGRWAAPVLCFSRSSRKANKKLKRLVNCSWVMVWRRARKLTYNKSAAAATSTSSSTASTTTTTTTTMSANSASTSRTDHRGTNLSSDSSCRYDYSSAVVSLQELMIAHNDPNNIDAGNPPPSITKRTAAATLAVPTYGRTY